MRRGNDGLWPWQRWRHARRWRKGAGAKSTTAEAREAREHLERFRRTPGGRTHHGLTGTVIDRRVLRPGRNLVLAVDTDGRMHGWLWHPSAPHAGDLLVYNLANKPGPHCAAVDASRWALVEEQVCYEVWAVPLGPWDPATGKPVDYKGNR